MELILRPASGWPPSTAAHGKRNRQSPLILHLAGKPVRDPRYGGVSSIGVRVTGPLWSERSVARLDSPERMSDGLNRGNRLRTSDSAWPNRPLALFRFSNLQSLLHD